MFLILPEVAHLNKLIGMEMIQLLGETKALLAKLLIGVVSIVAAIAAIDVIYQRMQHMREMRMSRQEIKDEYKETEGDPLVKGRLRQLRMERTRRRMMAQVPQSDVVVTNPTHYAVALKYDPASMAAPKMMAKGVDKVAQKIREIAKEHGIPIVENPPLARGLFAAVRRRPGSDAGILQGGGRGHQLYLQAEAPASVRLFGDGAGTALSAMMDPGWEMGVLFMHRV